MTVEQAQAAYREREQLQNAALLNMTEKERRLIARLRAVRSSSVPCTDFATIHSYSAGCFYTAMSLAFNYGFIKGQRAKR